MNKTYYQQIDETVYHSTLANGLNLFIIPKKDFQKTFVTYTTQFGSLDHRFKPHGADEFVSVPDGVAHFLEHKLFEKEEGDLFTEFAEHDAQVNAFTSFDRTSYLFSATNHIDDNILRLLKMVESPYFSEASVEKEKGIIAEEIKMYQEQPGYRLMFNTLRAMYQDHPVRVDIAGSVESIYEITKDDLYLCYETFYHPSNMVLFVVGDVDPEHIENLVRTHEDARGIVAQPEIERDPLNEPIEVIEHQVVESMALQSPRIMLGLKHPVYDLSRRQGVKEDIEMSFFFEMIYGEETNFYQSLLSQDLIDDTFSYQTVIERTYSFSLITSATTEPEQLKTLLLDELRARIGTLDDQHAFDLLKRQFIGEYISSLNAPEYIANQSTKFYFDGVSLFELLNVIDSITLDTMNETVRRRIDMNALVDSRLEIKKAMKAIVIGGSGTIGRAITHDLLSNGYEVIVTYHHTPLATLMDEFQGQPVQFVQLDLSQPVNLEEKLGFVRNLDALIYASGHSLFGMLQDMTDTDIHEAYQVHVFHFIKMTQYFVSQLIQSPHGRIVAISSIWGETGASFETIYSSMKAAQIGFVKSLAKELARTSVTVNAIAPGVVAGSMTDGLDHAARTALLEEVPQNRWVDPNEIAHATRFLLSPLSQSVTGTVQRINGGWYC